MAFSLSTTKLQSRMAKNLLYPINKFNHIAITKSRLQDYDL